MNTRTLQGLPASLEEADDKIQKEEFEIQDMDSAPILRVSSDAVVIEPEDKPLSKEDEALADLFGNFDDSDELLVGPGPGNMEIPAPGPEPPSGSSPPIMVAPPAPASSSAPPPIQPQPIEPHQIPGLPPGHSSDILPPPKTEVGKIVKTWPRWGGGTTMGGKPVRKYITKDKEQGGLPRPTPIAPDVWLEMPDHVRRKVHLE